MKQVLASGLTFGCVLLLTTVPRADAQNCELLTKGGIYDYTSTSYDSKQISSFVDWFRSHESTTYQQAKSEGIGINIPIDDVLVGADYGKSESGYSQFKKDVEKYHSAASSVSTKLTAVLRHINPLVITELSKCLSQNGLHAWLQMTENPTAFLLKVQYRSGGNPLLATVTQAPQYDNAMCRGLTKGKTFGGNTQKFLCKRIDPSKPATVVLNADVEIIGGDLALNGIPKIPKLPCNSLDSSGHCLSCSFDVVLKGRAPTAREFSCPNMAPGLKKASFDGDLTVVNNDGGWGGVAEILLREKAWPSTGASEQRITKDITSGSIPHMQLIVNGDEGADWVIFINICGVNEPEKNKNKANAGQRSCATLAGSKLEIEMLH